MIPQVDIQRNADAQRRLEKSFRQNMDDAKIYQEIDRAVGEVRGLEGALDARRDLREWVSTILVMAVGLIVLMCAAGVGLALFRIILSHVN